MDIITKLFNSKDELPYITFIVFTFSIITLLPYLITPWVCTNLLACPHITLNIPTTVLDYLYLLGTILFLIVTIRGWEWINQFRKRNLEYTFEPTDWPRGWIYSGRPEVIDETLHVKSSRAGLLLEEKIWKNCEISFEMRFDPQLYRSEHIGIVFRARDLDNYFMLEIRSKSIAPHIRFKSGWQATGVTGVSHFDFTDFKKIKMEVKNDTTFLFYEDERVFEWILPTHADVSHFEAGVENNKVDEAAALTKNLSGNHVQRIAFRLDYGMVGFRAHYNDQGAIIRNLKILPL